MTEDEEFIDEETCAKRLSISPQSLKVRRVRGSLDIPYIKLGNRQVRYHWPMVKDFLINKARTSQQKKKELAPSELTAITVPPRRGRPRLPI